MTEIINFVKDKITSYARYKKAVEELSNLSDRELLDLGITRYEISEVVKQSVRIQS